MGYSFRISRISTPRATLWSVVLLILAFTVFGLTANASLAARSATSDASAAATLASPIEGDAKSQTSGDRT